MRPLACAGSVGQQGAALQLRRAQEPRLPPLRTPAVLIAGVLVAALACAVALASLCGYAYCGQLSAGGLGPSAAPAPLPHCSPPSLPSRLARKVRSAARTCHGGLLLSSRILPAAQQGCGPTFLHAAPLQFSVGSGLACRTTCSQRSAPSTSITAPSGPLAAAAAVGCQAATAAAGQLQRKLGWALSPMAGKSLAGTYIFLQQL